MITIIDKDKKLNLKYTTITSIIRKYKLNNFFNDSLNDISKNFILCDNPNKVLDDIQEFYNKYDLDIDIYIVIRDLYNRDILWRSSVVYDINTNSIIKNRFAGNFDIERKILNDVRNNEYFNS